MSLQRILLVIRPTKLAFKLSLIFTVTGGWHTALCHSQQKLLTASKKQFDLLVVDQGCISMDLTSVNRTPAILLVENVHRIQEVDGLNVIDKINLNISPLVSIAEKVRISFQSHSLKKCIL